MSLILNNYCIKSIIKVMVLVNFTCKKKFEKCKEKLDIKIDTLLKFVYNLYNVQKNKLYEHY